ncbi:MAG: SpoIIE family protein phosphatase [Bacteroidetes bacterium]|nr:SpoIIE family protein phosphatase [Bacteroidota bacterium]
MYLPKDIVAGDFYWMETPGADDTLFFAVCDCTGHGVPGAMVSVVCHNALNRTVREFFITQPAQILDKVTELVVQAFSLNNADNDEIKDGMDASLCALNTTTGHLQWAGANNPLWVVKLNGELVEYKPTSSQLENPVILCHLQISQSNWKKAIYYTCLRMVMPTSVAVN